MIGPALKRLIEHVKASKIILEKDAINDEEKESLSQHGKNIGKILSTLETKTDLWIQYLNGLFPTDREA
jgi:hypothetical protein